MGSQQIVPIRFAFMRLPVGWTVAKGALWGRMESVKSVAAIALKELDGWRYRDKFFELPSGDIDRLAAFLNDVGAWPGHGEPNPNTPGHALRFPFMVQPDDVWAFRDDLKHALTNRKTFKEAIAPVLSRPKTWVDLYSPQPANNFSLRFELSSVAAGVITLTNARHMLFATALADISRGVQFRICKRKDCQIPFAIMDKRQKRKKYHDDNCQHLALIRRGRR